jgi:DNA-binding transcriptional LysR family regulator
VCSSDLERLLGKAGLYTSRPLMESDDMIQLLNAVRGGLGYFAAFGPLARDFGKMDGIRRLPFVDPLPPIEIRQAVREDVEDDPVISSLAEYLFR